MTQYIDGREVPSILLDSTRNLTLVSLGSIDDVQLASSLKEYRCNSQVAAMMANVGEIHIVPAEIKSKFAGYGLKISIFKAWSELYHAALAEYESRQRRPKLF